MKEGSLDAPTRHVIPWESPEFADKANTQAEMRRIFDICHTCRRCFNLCDAFPRLFDLIDNSSTGELDAVASADFGKVAAACTLCDMCFMTKCPYVPPHSFDVDFPHVMLRYRVARFKEHATSWGRRAISNTDRNGRLARFVAPLANWAGNRRNHLLRAALEMLADIDRRAELPPYQRRTFMARARASSPPRDAAAPAAGRKAVLFATCFVNYNNPGIGEATRAVLAKNGVDTQVLYPCCCGMPQFEEGDLEAVARSARKVAAAFGPYIDKGCDVIALVPSCALMLKFEWPLVVPEDEAVKKLARATFDISEYVIDIAKKEGLVPPPSGLDGGVTLHIACHARAQNMGQKATEMLRLLPDTEISVIERCSGHGGSWGVLKENFDTALKVGRPVARQAAANAKPNLASECPLAAIHILQGMEAFAEGKALPEKALHPIELMARAYGLDGFDAPQRRTE